MSHEYLFAHGIISWHWRKSCSCTPYPAIDKTVIQWNSWVPDLHKRCTKFKSPPPSAAYMHQGIGSALVQIMACCLFGAKPLSKPMLGYCQLESRNNPSEILVKIQNFSFIKMHLKSSLARWRPFCPGEMILSRAPGYLQIMNIHITVFYCLSVVPINTNMITI